MLDLYDPAGGNAKQLRLVLDKSEKQMQKLQKQRLVLDDAIKRLSRGMKLVRKTLAKRP